MELQESKEKNVSNRALLGSLLIMSAALLWAVDGLIRRNLYSLPPITIIFLEHLFGFLILFPFVYKQLFKTKMSKREWFLVLLVSLLSGLLGTLWFTTALLKVNFISFSVVFLLQKLQPIFAISTAVVFLKERFDKRYIIWAGLAILGAYFVTFDRGYVNLATGQGTIIAALYALGAAFAWGSSTTFSKILLGKVSAAVSTFYRFLFTLIIALPIVLFFGYSKSLVSLTITQVGLFLLIAISTGMVALVLYYKGLERTPVHISTILELLFPFAAIIIDMVVFRNVLSMWQWLATIVFLFSIYRIVKLRHIITKPQ